MRQAIATKGQKRRLPARLRVSAYKHEVAYAPELQRRSAVLRRQARHINMWAWPDSVGSFHESAIRGIVDLVMGRHFIFLRQITISLWLMERWHGVMWQDARRYCLMLY